jgi:HNH endonuclease
VTRPRLLDLPHGYQTVVDEADWWLVRDLTLYRGQNGYVFYSVWRDGKSDPRLLHRLLMDAPKGAHVDHINGNKLDNQRSNLRVVTNQQNQVNRKRLNKNNTSGTRGVARTNASARKPWRAQIMVARKAIHLGLFATEAEAVAARREAELRYFGEQCP